MDLVVGGNGHRQLGYLLGANHLEEEYDFKPNLRSNKGCV
jgi:hypothetical protein